VAFSSTERRPATRRATAQEPAEKMAKYALIAAATLVVVVVGVVGVLMFWNVPAPSARIEHVVPDAKLPK
jgi:flagellar basal body-associated protein FliL